MGEVISCMGRKFWQCQSRKKERKRQTLNKTDSRDRAFPTSGVQLRTNIFCNQQLHIGTQYDIVCHHLHFSPFQFSLQLNLPQMGQGALLLALPISFLQQTKCFQQTLDLVHSILSLHLLHPLWLLGVMAPQQLMMMKRMRKHC